MRKIIFLWCLLLTVIGVNSQELNAKVTVNSDKIAGSNKQIFSTLEKSLTEFINQTKWTDKNFKPQERINCAFTIIVNSQPSPNRFDASIQIQSTRPVYNTSYATPVINLKDNDFSFRYNEFDPLIFNPTTFDSNLVSTIVFYVYVILGVDADTFALNGGKAYLKQAENVMLQAQQSGISAWSNQVGGKQNRFTLIDNLLSPKLISFKNTLYNYHRKGLDILSEDKQKGKQFIENAVTSIQSLYNKTISNYLIRLFLDAKSDEIVALFSDGPSTSNTQNMINVLQRVSPTNRRKWQKIN